MEKVDPVEIIAQTIRGETGIDGADAVAHSVVAALDEAGYVVRKKPAPRKAAAPVEPFAPNTGDPALDEFMRKHHRHDWEPRLRLAVKPNRPGMINMPAPPKPRPHEPFSGRTTLLNTERAQVMRDNNYIQHSA